jgi:hypothetical protein
MSLEHHQSVYSLHPAKRFMVHDLVSCDWNCNGRITCHRILSIRQGVRWSQTGTMFLVEPPVSSQGRGDWIDAAWFFKDGLELL